MTARPMLKVSQGAVTVVRGVLIGLALLAGWLGAIVGMLFALVHFDWSASIALVAVFIALGIHTARHTGTSSRALGSQNDG